MPGGTCTAASSSPDSSLELTAGFICFPESSNCFTLWILMFPLLQETLWMLPCESSCSLSDDNLTRVGVLCELGWFKLSISNSSSSSSDSVWGFPAMLRRNSLPTAIEGGPSLSLLITVTIGDLFLRGFRSLLHLWAILVMQPFHISVCCSGDTPEPNLWRTSAKKR